MPTHLFLRSDLPPSELTLKQKARLEAAQTEPRFQKMLSSALDREIFVDLAKTYLDTCCGASTCLRPTSRPYLYKQQRFITGEEALGLQGILPDDFPYMKTLIENGKDHFMRDLAGNAFTSSACAAALLAFCSHCTGAPRQVECVQAISISCPVMAQSLVLGIRKIENRRYPLAPGVYAVHMSKRSAKPTSVVSDLMAQSDIPLWTAAEIKERVGKVIGVALSGQNTDFHCTSEEFTRLGPWADKDAGRYHHSEYIHTYMLARHY